MAILKCCLTDSFTRLHMIWSLIGTLTCLRLLEPELSLIYLLHFQCHSPPRLNHTDAPASFHQDCVIKVHHQVEEGRLQP